MDTIINRMYAYQLKNGVKNQCMTNSQYIYDSMRYSGVSAARVCATLVLHQGDMVLNIINHLVVRVNDRIIDASYDVASLKGKKYCFTVAEFLEACKELNLHLPLKKKTIENFVHFLGISKRMNAGEILVSDKIYYNKQADFVAERR